jgi:hypothetical protein
MMSFFWIFCVMRIVFVGFGELGFLFYDLGVRLCHGPIRRLVHGYQSTVVITNRQLRRNDVAGRCILEAFRNLLFLLFFYYFTLSLLFAVKERESRRFLTESI